MEHSSLSLRQYLSPNMCVLNISFVASEQDLKLEVPVSIPSSGRKVGLPQEPLDFRTPTSNNGCPPLELPSLWGTRVQAESLLMMHPGKF